MRPKLAFVLAVAISLAGSAFITSTAAHAGPTLSCANPVTVTGPEGGVAFANHYRYNNDEWTGTGTTVGTVCDQGDWTATVTETNQQLQVRTYPDGEFTGTDWSNCSSQHAISEFASATATFSIAPPTARAKWDAATDTYIGGGACPGTSTEVMVWEKWHGISIPTAQLHTTIAGVKYDIYHSGGYVQVRRHRQVLSGSVDMLGLWQYLAAQGLISLSSTHVFTQHGYEVLSTFNKPVAFTSTGFTFDYTLKSAAPARKVS